MSVAAVVVVSANRRDSCGDQVDRSLPGCFWHPPLSPPAVDRRDLHTDMSRRAHGAAELLVDTADLVRREGDPLSPGADEQLLLSSPDPCRQTRADRFCHERGDKG